MSWTGHVTANLRNVAVLPEPVDRDNLHPAANFYKYKGWLIARAILSDMRRLDARGTLARNLPINAYRLQNGRTQGPVNASYRIDGSTVHLGGTLTAGTVTYKLPRHLWPARLGSWDVSKDAAGSARIGISLTGELILAYLGSDDYVRLDGITYEPARI